MLSVNVLGAGGHVGRSSFEVRFENGINILLDCGVQLSDKNEFLPDFSNLFEKPKKNQPPWKPAKLKSTISAILITHFHLDHVGALPYFTEVLGYEGPIYMSMPTKHQAEILLYDCWISCKDKLTINYCGDLKRYFSNQNSYRITESMLKSCINKIECLDYFEQLKLKDIEILMIPAGHVPGASMFSLASKYSRIIYTGDYTLPDNEILYETLKDRDTVRMRNSSLIISEATYASQVRDPNVAIMREICSTILEVVKAGGKVLIPSSALGKAQEVAIALAIYWKKYNISTPIIFGSKLMSRGWQIFSELNNDNEFIEDTRFIGSYISFSNASNVIDADYPLIFFSTPSSLDIGLTHQIFLKWSQNSKNMILLTGYVSSSIIASQVISGNKVLNFNNQTLEIKAKFRYFSLGSHADSFALQKLIKQLNPSHCMLIHGEFSGIQLLASTLRKICHRPIYTPKDNEFIIIRTPVYKSIILSDSKDLTERHIFDFEHNMHQVMRHLKSKVNKLELSSDYIENKIKFTSKIIRLLRKYSGD